MGLEDNGDLALAEFNAGKIVLKNPPFAVTLETSSICNLRCLMCPQAIGAVDRPKHMDQSYTEMLSGFISTATSMQLHGIGEPLASPSFWETLKLLRPECASSINSNFTLLNESKTQLLLESNLKIINVSLDAATKETYRKIRRYDFDIPIKNIKAFIAGRNNKGASLPEIHINMTLMRENIEELKDFVALANDLGVDKVQVWQLNAMPREQMKMYEFQFDDYAFSYEEQGLWNYPELSDKNVKEALAYAEEINMPMMTDINKDMYYGEGI